MKRSRIQESPSAGAAEDLKKLKRESSSSHVQGGAGFRTPTKGSADPFVLTIDDNASDSFEGARAKGDGHSNNSNEAANGNVKVVTADYSAKRKALLEGKPHAAKLGRTRVVYAREETEDVSQATIVIRDVNKEDVYSKFGIKGRKTIQDAFYALLQLVIDHEEELVGDSAYHAEKAFIRKARAWRDGALGNVNFDPPEFRVVTRKRIDASTPSRKSITIPVDEDRSVGVTLIFGERGLQFSLSNFDDLGLACGVYLYLWETAKLLQYLCRPFEFLPEQRRLHVQPESDDFF